MTTPIANVMPYGITYIPNLAAGKEYMEVHDSAGSVKITSSAILAPAGVFILQISSQMTGDTILQLTYPDGSPSRRTVVFTDGGRYMETLSGENIEYIRVGNTALAANKAANRRTTLQIIPIPNPT